MKIELMDKCKKELLPLIDPFRKSTDELDHYEFASDRYFQAKMQCEFHCDNSLSFYDDIDIICCIGFAGFEHLCPKVQDLLGIKIEGYPKEQVREIIERYEQECQSSEIGQD